MGKDQSDKSDDELPSTGTRRDAHSYYGKPKSKSVKMKDYRIAVKKHYRMLDKSTKKVRQHKEETGKEILARIMREINASIARKERRKKSRI